MSIIPHGTEGREYWSIAGKAHRPLLSVMAMISLGPALRTMLLLPIPCGMEDWGTAIKGTLVTGDELVLRQVVWWDSGQLSCLC